MKVSIITATFNSASHIADCIRSVAEQSYENIEHIIVDGLSTDQTMDLVKSSQADNANLKWISEADSGIYDALNKGIDMATGDIIGFVHSDDMLAASTLIEQIVGCFQEESVDGLYGDLKYVDAMDPNKTIRYWKSSEFRMNDLNSGWMPAHPTLFLKRQVYEHYGRFNKELKIAADYDFILRIFKDSNFQWAYLSEVITLMRVGGASNQSLKNILNKSQEDLWALRTNGFKFPFWILMKKNLRKIPQWFIN